MSKPKIYSFCSAGCKWETVHKDDFLKAATYYQISEDGSDTCYLEIGKQYKIYATNDETTGFGCSIKLLYYADDLAKAYTFNIPNNDKYADSIVFKLLEATVNDTNTTLTLVYELAGVRYTETISGSDVYLYQTLDGEDKYLYVSNATKVCLYNADASMTVIPDVNTMSDGIYQITVDKSGGIRIERNENLSGITGGTSEAIEINSNGIRVVRNTSLLDGTTEFTLSPIPQINGVNVATVDDITNAIGDIETLLEALDTGSGV